MEQDKSRIETQSVEIHHVTKAFSDYESYYFPINHHQVRDILGQILTQIEAMNLNEKSEKASKAIFTQMVWRWFDEAMDNSVTSYEPAGLRPIKSKSCDNRKLPSAVIVEDKPEYVHNEGMSR